MKPLLAAVVILLFCTPASAVKFCIKYTVTMTDAGIGEDYLPTSNYALWARGIWARVHAVDGTTKTVVFDGFTDDGYGANGTACTSPISYTNPDSYEITIYSQGRIQGQRLYVWRATSDSSTSCEADSDCPTGQECNYGICNTYYDSVVSWTKPIPDTGDGTKTVDFGAIAFDTKPQRKAFNSYQLVAWALYRHTGGVVPYRSGTDMWIVNSFDTGGKCAYPGASETDVGFNCYAQKWVSLHEFGHQMAGYVHSDLNNNHCNNVQNHQDCPEPGCPGDCAGHGMGSAQVSRCALGEGFATYYAADAFNDHNDTDNSCYFRYWAEGNPTLSCNTGDAYYSTSYFDDYCKIHDPATCSGASPGCVDGLASSAGMSTELGWIRLWWNIHTGGSTVVSYNEIVDFFQDASPEVDWGIDDAYQVLDARSDDPDVDGTLESRWNLFKDDNAIDQ